MAAAGGGGPGASSLLYSTPSRSRSVDRSHVPFRFQSLTTRETLICPGWETSVVPVSQPGTPGRDKRGCPFVPVGNTNRDKRCCQRHVPGAPFCPGWCYQPGQKSSFSFLFLFSQLFFYFDHTFTFQLNLCIVIRCVRSPLIYTYI